MFGTIRRVVLAVAGAAALVAAARAQADHDRYQGGRRHEDSPPPVALRPAAR